MYGWMDGFFSFFPMLSRFLPPLGCCLILLTKFCSVPLHSRGSVGSRLKNLWVCFPIKPPGGGEPHVLTHQSPLINEHPPHQLYSVPIALFYRRLNHNNTDNGMMMSSYFQFSSEEINHRWGSPAALHRLGVQTCADGPRLCFCFLVVNVVAVVVVFMQVGLVESLV